MNWEKSKAITPLKRDFLKSFFALEKRFFLTGGSALGLFYLQHRFSYDLDLFSKEHVAWQELDGVMRLCTSEINAELELIRDSPTFRRYNVTRNDSSEIIDIVVNVESQIDPEKLWIDNIQVDTLHEIMLNKITTLISRCELKDIVDLFFLEKEGLRIETYFEEARQKDGGLDPAMISLLLDSITVSEVPDYLIESLTLEELHSFIHNLQRRMALLAYPETK